jgi:MraZ protein
VFLGTHAPRLDEKGRLFLPAKFREELAEGLVITKGQERCLYVFPTGEFGRLTEALRTSPVTHKGLRDYSRVFFAGASDEVPDRQGRITIPSALREYAGLSRDCAVIGANTRVEIWDAAAWEAYLAEQEPVFSQLGEEVLPGVL